MEIDKIHSCYLGPGISPEHLIPEHYFMYLLQGTYVAYDGEKKYISNPGDAIIARKNHLIRYTKNKVDNEFHKIVIALDEPFLRSFLEKHPYKPGVFDNDDSILTVETNALVRNFVNSLEPYYKGSEKLDPDFADVKREELLIILLKQNPAWAHVFFNFSIPQRVDLETFMNKNFRFNIKLEQFAFLAGRSLSTFKRDFNKVFNEMPGTWLTRKRLEEAHFQIKNQHKKPGDVYLEVGFENLSHFSYAFKKQFGKSPAAVQKAQ
ncbi:AraC family transcriptional regulator [Niastella yeongjuensis]|uniref:AraC family transcriptional regulator n=1 Tax=Niastella yeongjuensis TaxID=354355 RepID=A0A1V9EEG4_9BACT|nr:AraC family transcriptional regulator [Niastella yeongjuensis]OQP44441.1 AraC family transcriptional regulator [Niastella yeongjuensis]SEO87604.1 AraC-type DNA-binding protein [Niastella yeongjuensis]